MTTHAAWFTLVGRVLLAAMFLMSGINKMTDSAGTQQYMAAMGMTWMTPLFYIGAVLLEVGGALSVMLGYRARIGAWLLIAFMIPTTWVFHSNFADPNQMIHFLKNLSVLGGLLYVATYGSGPLSLDAGLARAEETSKGPTTIQKRAVNQ